MRLILALAAATGAHLLVSPGRPKVVPVPTVRSVAVGLGSTVASIVFGAGAFGAIAIGGACVATPGMVAAARARRAAAAARERWPDFLAVVRSRIGTGEPLPDAVRAASRLVGGPFLDLDRAWGGSFVAELEAARRRWSDPVADRVLTTLRIASTTGGAHVDAVLSALAVSLSDEMRIRSAHDAALTQQRLTAGVALISPWAILALSVATNPQAAAEFGSPTGHALIALGVVATLTGYVFARRAARLSEAPRVFA